MSAVQFLTQSDPRLLAVAGGVAFAIYLHNFPMRGDIGLLTEVALGALLYVVDRSVGDAKFFMAVGFAFSMVAIQYITMERSTFAYRLWPLHPLYKLPGPILNKMTNLKLAHMRKRYLVIKDLHKKYGKVVRTGYNTLSINSPNAVSAIYSSSNAFHKSKAYIPGRVHGEGLFFIQDRDEHSARRKIWAPGFTPSAIANYKPTIEKGVDQMLETLWKGRKGPHGTVDFTKVIQHWSYNVMGELCYGHANRIEMMEDVESGQMATVVFESLGELPALFDFVWYLPVTTSINALETLVERLIIARSRSNEGSSNDLASHLLGEHDPSLPKLNSDDLKIDSFFAIQAGSDTTSGVLTVLLYYLLRDKDTYNRLQAELEAAFPGPDAPLNLQTLNRLPFSIAVCEESLRLGTPFGGLPRVVPKGGHVLDDFFVPEGTIVAVPPWASQTSPENVWPEPKEFRPQRWMPDGLGPDGRLVKQGMLSFSYGPFGCLGKLLAQQELRQVTARLLLTYNLKLSPKFDNEAFVKGIDSMRATIFRYPLLITAEKTQCIVGLAMKLCLRRSIVIDITSPEDHRTSMASC